MSQREIEASKVVSDAIPQGAKRGSYLVQRCSSCGRTMSLGEGDTLFGDKWFHGVCWTLEAEAKR
jgi:hypothetical protein